MKNQPVYVSVLIPLAVHGSYHYLVPEEMYRRASVGVRVVVPFGSKRFYTAIVERIESSLPTGVQTPKSVLAILDSKPIVKTEDIAFWHWMSSYYLCSVGEVLRTAFPSALLPESHTEVVANPNYEATTVLPALDTKIMDLLQLAKDQSMSLGELQRQLGRPALPAFVRLIASEAIRVSEEIFALPKGRREQIVGLRPDLVKDEEALCEEMGRLNRAPQQQKLLLSLLELLQQESTGLGSSVPIKKLCRGDSRKTSALRALVQRGILLRSDRLIELEPMARLQGLPDLEVAPELPENQISVYYQEDIYRKEQLIEQLVNDYLAEGGQVLLLTPEVQRPPTERGLLNRLSLRHGDRVQLYSSGQSLSDRITLWQRLSSEVPSMLVAGNRSAIFLPFDDLRLIIIDEEQEYGYKQQSPSPRYHARDAAMVVAQLKGAKVLICSETPSSETLHNIAVGKWASFSPQGGRRRPSPIAIETVDMKKLYRQHRLSACESISPQLEKGIADSLNRGKRVTLIQNRRGYAPYIKCGHCSQSLRCPHCSVSLTYYKQRGKLVCHYCGYEQLIPHTCPNCNSSQKEDLQPHNFGTERVVEEISKLFPKARILRIDAELARSKKRLAETLGQIESGDVDIIVGTQMMAGLPIWQNIDLIGVVSLDSILAFPDFRTDERAYQLLYQQAIRSAQANATDSPARMILQTNDPESPFIQSLAKGDYHQFVQEVLQERQLCFFPPYSRLTLIVLRSSDKAIVSHTARQFALLLKARLPRETVVNLFTPIVDRIDRYYIRHIMLRRPTHLSAQLERRAISAAQRELLATLPEAKKCKIHYDVDPL
ncbi:MAG: primosomal protein N' [Porphyromonas sp.]|nr:primosomal protein N' [Porphyromonas sp.]